MERQHPSTKTRPAKAAGIDVGKRRLDAAVQGGEAAAFANDEDGLAELVAWLKAREVGRVGLEASGGYERRARLALEAAGLAVVLHQPLEVRLFARLKRLKAKNDRLDARLIAAFTAQAGDARAGALDPRLADLAERLSAYEHASDQAAGLKTFLAQVEAEDLAAVLREALARLLALKAALLREALARLKAHDDLARRYKLLLSLPGVGPAVAACLVVRMPELGALARGQAASLAGVAPFDRDSGDASRPRAIAGGRARPRRMLYIAALAARRVDDALKAFADALAARGKKPKLVLVALMRKLVEAANLVLKRGTPWIPSPAP